MKNDKNNKATEEKDRFIRAIKNLETSELEKVYYVMEGMKIASKNISARNNKKV